MKTNSLRINQLSKPAYERYLQYLQALDNLDIDAYARFLAIGHHNTATDNGTGIEFLKEKLLWQS